MIGDPILGPLQDNGGPTKTHALLSDSSAIDVGNNSICASMPVGNRDQRNESRPVGDDCDIGAYEYRTESSFFTIPTANGKTVIIDL